MAKRAPELGSIEWIPLQSDAEEDAGILVGIRHVGPRVARQWARRFKQLQQNERARVRKLQNALIEECGSRAAAEAADPELFENYATPESDDEYQALFDDMFREAVAGLRGVPSLGDDDQEGALRRLDYVGIEALIALAAAIQIQQQLSPAQFFRSPGHGDPEPHGPADEARESGGASGVD